MSPISYGPSGDNAGLRLSRPQGIFQVWPELMITVNKKTKKALLANIYFLAKFSNYKYKLKMLLDVLT